MTILCWSFVRDDLEREEVLPPAGACPPRRGTRSGVGGLRSSRSTKPHSQKSLPLREDEAEKYLMGIDAFRLTVSGVEDTLQIHTHMCHSG